MASNKELITAIAAICAELEIETPDTKDLNNSQLSGLLKDFKAQQPPAETTPGEAPEETGFKVMPRKAITTKRGIIAAGEKIEAKDLSGGEVAFKAFIKSKHIGRA